MKKICVVGLVLVLWMGAEGYVIQTHRNTRGRIVNIGWSASRAGAGIPFVVNAGSFPFAEADVVRIARRGFNRWGEVPSAFIAFEYEGTTQIPASPSDRRNVIIYDETGQILNAPEGTGVIAIARINWNDDGYITDVDIIFNGRDFDFSVNEDNTPRNHVDLEGVMTHEIGHLLGLDHSPLVGDPEVRPTMYPYHTPEAPQEERSLQPDDRAGITAIYPVEELTGGVSGQVLGAERPVFGVHVVAYRAGTQVFVASALSGSTGAQTGSSSDGRYEILGLPPGDYHMAIEPHHRTISPENFGGIFQTSFDENFDIEYFNNAFRQANAQIVRVEIDQVIANIDFALGPSAPGAPFIQRPNFPTNTPDPNGPYRFSATVTDNEGVAAVELHYRINGGSVQVARTARAGDDVFTAEIDGQRVGTIIEYRLIARDGDGNETPLPPLELPMLRFEVLALSGAPVAFVALREANALAVIDMGPGKEVARIPTGETPLSVLMTPDERYIFVANAGSGSSTSENRVMAIETATHRVAAILEVGNAPLDLALSADGRLVYVTNSRDRSISILEVATLTARAARIRVPVAERGPYGVAVSLDGSRVYVTDIEGDQVLVIDPSIRATIARVNVIADPRSLVLSADGKRLYVSGGDFDENGDGGISVVDTDALSVIATIRTDDSGIFRMALSPDGSRLYATDRVNAQLLVIDVAQNRVTHRVDVLPGGEETRELFVSRDGSRVYVTNQDSDDLVVFDAESLQILRTLRLSDGPRGVAIRPQPAVFLPLREVANQADFDGSGKIDFGDFLLFVSAYGADNPDARFDLDDDGQVNFSDFLLFVSVFGKTAGA